MNKVMLEQGETMKQLRAREKLLTDCGRVADVIRRNPGLPSRDVVADRCGLSRARVMKCMKAMNEDTVPGGRFEYAEHKPRSGPFAGQTVKGWFSMHIASHHPLMDQADVHAEKIGIGIVRSRVIRLLAADGMTSAQARTALSDICARLGISPDDLESEDVDAIVELILNHA